MKLQAATLIALTGLVAPMGAWAQTHTRTDTLTYEDNKTHWVIGLPKTSTTAGAVEYEHVYNAQALPIESRAFGKPKYKATYNADGTLATVSDGRDGPSYDTTVSYSDWVRGIPQRIDYPDGTSESAEVDTLGRIKSVTDETDAKTCYDYDAMGRLSKITHPSETEPGACSVSNWFITTITFNNATGAAYGMPAGQWRQTTYTGNARRVVLFDALWRPVVEQTLDFYNVPNSTKEIFRRYDDDGRVVFESYPMDSKGLAVYTDPALKGTTTTYDALGRTTQVKQDSELGALLTTNEYLAGFKTRVTNPRGLQTTTSFYAWDTPTQDYPLKLVHPESAVTTILRDAYGKPKEITRYHVNTALGWQRRYFQYNANQELCSRTEGETGTTAMGYDAAGNLAWSAGGQSWSPTGPCASPYDAAVAARRVDRTYDQRNRVRTLAFVDGRGDTTYGYTLDGQLEALTVDNGNGELVTTTYAYNKRRLLTNETLQTGTNSWSLGYQYSGYGHVSSHTYPNGITVAYAPDPLGRATTVGSYASGVLYHPNNAVEAFTFGNGETHQMWQNVRGLPDRSRDAAGAVALVDDSYDYDANGNVAAITDALTGNVGNRDMTYDGLDRLKTVVAPGMFGTASYTYDVLDNLTRVAIGGPKARDHYYCYDGTVRLTNVKSGSCSGTSVIGLGYDVQGNLANKNGVGYAFDYGNRLRTVTQTSGATSTYAYDGHGRRVRATDSGVDIFSMYALDGTLMYQEDLKRNKRIYHMYLSGDPVAQVEVDITTGATENRYLHTDALGSPVVVTNAQSGILERTQYEPYGLVINRSLRDGPGYTGHVEDAATALIHMQQRYYDPTIGRFLSVDPVGVSPINGLNFNRYWYASNNPYKNKDPDGRCDGPSTCAIDRDIAAMNRGDMSRDEFMDRSEARAAGAGIGVVLVTVGRALLPALPVATKVAIKEAKQEVREDRKQRNKPPGPDPAAEGRPHSRIERPGPDGQYTTHNGDGTYKQYRGSGQDHGGIPRPNVKETKLNTAPNGQQYPSKPEVRPARPEEIPGGR